MSETGSGLLVCFFYQKHLFQEKNYIYFVFFNYEFDKKLTFYFLVIIKILFLSVIIIDILLIRLICCLFFKNRLKIVILQKKKLTKN